MPTLENETFDSAIPEPEVWAKVWFLIRDLERTERIGEMISKWDTAIQFFHSFEEHQFGHGEARPIDRKIHQSLLHMLIGLGQRLEIVTEKFSDSDLTNFGVTKADLAADVRELEESFSIFYGPEPGEVPQSFIEALADFEAGRVVPMETALNEPPPGARDE